MYTDSMLDATRVYGQLCGEVPRGTSLRFDSVEMVRKRLDPAMYSRRYPIRRLPKLFLPWKWKCTGTRRNMPPRTP